MPCSMTGNVTESFFSLLRFGVLGGEAPAVSLDAKQWAELYALARAQAVQAVVFDALGALAEDSGLPAELSAKWLLEVKAIERNNARIAEVVRVQKQAWEKRGIRAVELKGQTLSAMYPVPQHRICGDVDWWFPEPGDWDKALAAVRENGLEINVDSDGDMHYALGGVTVEHHRDGLVSEDPVGVLLMLIGHVLHHAMTSGVGLRQFCDLVLAYRHFEGQYRREELEKALRKMSMLTWSRLLDDCIDRVFCTSYGDGRHAGDAERLLELVMDDGNFGMAKEHRFSGFCSRAALFLRIAPGRFIRRWGGLFLGRIKRVFVK